MQLVKELSIPSGVDKQLPRLAQSEVPMKLLAELRLIAHSS